MNRKQRKSSQGDLADAVVVTRQMINAIEPELYDPSLELAFTLVDYVDCHVEDLFSPESTTPE